MTDDLIVGQADGVNVVGKLKVSLHKNKGNGVAWKYWLYSLIIIKLLLQNQNQKIAEHYLLWDNMISLVIIEG